MMPPDCSVCGKRFDPFRQPGLGGGGLVRFADYRPLPDGMTGHPEGTAWLCPRHYRRGKSLQHLPMAEALAQVRRRRLGSAALRLAGLVLLLAAAVTGWNVAGPVELPDVDKGYVVRVTSGDLEGKLLPFDGAALAVRWLERDTRPAWNPARILWQQLKYNAWTRGYDVVLWIEPGNRNLSLPHFAIYQRGHTLFLRLEFRGRNRVLEASFTADELEQALAGFL